MGFDPVNAFNLILGRIDRVCVALEASVKEEKKIAVALDRIAAALEEKRD
jgi:hypothetical protein